MHEDEGRPTSPISTTLVTPLEKTTIDSILWDIECKGPKQAVKIYAHDNPQNYWTINVTATHNVGDICRIISQKMGSNAKFQLVEVCSGREKILDNGDLVLEVLSKWRKSKKYQLFIQPISKSPSKSSNNNNNDSFNSLLATEEQRDASSVRIYYHLNPATYWTLPMTITLTCSDVCEHISTKLQLPEKESCFIYLVDDSRIHAGSVTPMTQVAPDQNMKALLLQHRNTPARFVVTFKQLSESSVIPPLKENTDTPPKPSPPSTFQLSGSNSPSSFSIPSSIPSSISPSISPSPSTPISSPPPNDSPSLRTTKQYFNSRLYFPSASSSTSDSPVYSLPPPSSSPTLSVYKPSLSSLNSASFNYSRSPISSPSSSPVSARRGTRELSQTSLSPSSSPSLSSTPPKNSPTLSPTKTQEQKISYLEQLRNDIKEEHKTMDRRYKTYDDSWLDIPGYDFKSNDKQSNNNNNNNNKQYNFDSTNNHSLNRVSRELFPEDTLDKIKEETYLMHPTELSASTRKDALRDVTTLNDQARDQYREELSNYQQKLKNAFATIK